MVRNAETAAQKAAAAAHLPASDLPKVVANTTDPQSRIMPTRRGFLQGYNAQIAVTSDQLIVAIKVGQSTNDQRSFTPMMRAAHEAATRIHTVTGNADHVIGTVLADAGYNSESNLNVAGPDRLIALGKGRDQARAAVEEPEHGGVSDRLCKGVTSNLSRRGGSREESRHGRSTGHCRGGTTSTRA